MALLSAGCAAPANPSFPVSMADAKAALREMEAAPKRLARPVVLLGGYHDPGFGALVWRHEVHRWAKDARIAEVSFPFSRDFDQCRREVIAAVDRAFPTDDPDATVEVDVIGTSMGGLVGRYAAVQKPGERRLRVARLITISSPHRGAAWARLPAMSRLHADMRQASEFLENLEKPRPRRRRMIMSSCRTCGWATASSVRRTPRPPGRTRGGCPAMRSPSPILR